MGLSRSGGQASEQGILPAETEGEKGPPSCTEQIAGRKGLRKGWA